MDTFLKLNIVLLRILGFLPVGFQHDQNDKPKKRSSIESLSRVTAVILLILAPLLLLNYFLRLFNFEKGDLTLQIMYGFNTLSIVVVDLAPRIMGILYGNKISDIVQSFEHFDIFFKSQQRNQSQAQKQAGTQKIEQTGKTIHVIDTKIKALHHDLEKQKQNQAELFYVTSGNSNKIDLDRNSTNTKSRNEDPQNGCIFNQRFKKYRFYSWYLISVCLYCWTAFLYIHAYFENEKSLKMEETRFFRFPYKWMFHTNEIIAEILILLTTSVTVGFILTMGTHLIQSYKMFCEVLENQYDLYVTTTTTTTAGIKTSCGVNDIVNDSINLDMNLDFSFKRRYLEEFGRLQKCMHSFNEVAGVLALTNLFNLIMWLNYGIYTLIWPLHGNITNILSFTTALMMITLILSIGNHMKIEMSKSKEKLSRIVIMDKMKKTYVPPKIIEITAWVISWKWEYNGRNICTISYGLIPGITCTVMVFMTFLIQLKLSEADPRGHYGNNTDTGLLPLL